MARRTLRAASTPAPDEPEDSEAEATSSDDDEPVEANLATRTRRNNAGNRMAALIEDEAAAEVEEMFKEEEDDNEFENKEEKDEFDSDFGSTDEDAGDDEDDEEAGERQLRREAKEAKKAERGKRKGFQAPVHPFARQTKAARKAAAAKQAGPVASTSATTLDEDGEPAKKRKKVVVDPAFLVPQRESSRRQAVQNKKQVQDRLKEVEQRKATTTPRPTKKQQATLTQADLIAEALEVEEQNRAALLAFYAAEEERREAERVAGMRYEIIGPKLTFLSRVQDRVDNKGKGKEGDKDQMEKGRRRLIEVVGESGSKGWKASGAETGGLVQEHDASTARGRKGVTTASTSLNSILNSTDHTPGPSTPPEPQEYARNWLVFDNFEGSRADELDALFGDHADWSKRPMPVGQLGTCPFTGLPARYRDPLTLVPYATISAFHQLRAMASPHPPFVWSDALSAYTGASGFGLMADVELAWGRRPNAQPERYAAAGPHAQLQHQRATSALPPTLYFSTVPGAFQQQQQRVPRQQQQPEDNPYKISYAHAGGSGRGQRGRASLDAAPPQAQGPSAPPPPQQQQQQAPVPQQHVQAPMQQQAPTARSIPGSGAAFGGGVSVNSQGQAVLPPLGGLPPLPPFPT